MRRVVSLACAFCVLAIIAIVTVSPLDWRPPDIFDVNVDRAIAFAMLGALFTGAYPRRWRWIALATACIAFGLELSQLLAETRHARLEDALVKLGGGIAGIALALCAREAWFILNPHHRPDATGDGQRETHIASHMLTSVHFDAADGTLRLRFTDGTERAFADIQEGEAINLLNAPLPGRYDLDHLQDREAA